MDILNKNQRNSARWRIVSILGIVLVLNALVVYSMHGAYSSTGTDEIEQLNQELKKQENFYKGKVNDLSNENEKLRKQLQAASKDGGEDQVMELLKIKLEDCEKERDKLEEKVEKKDEKIEGLRDRLAGCDC